MSIDVPATPPPGGTAPASLRDQAEALLHQRESERTAAGPPERLSPEHAQRALHELQVHQIELEMQNEELHRVRSEMEASRERYSELFDLAPVGYCRLSDAGVILQANLAAASLLGLPRAALTRQPAIRFIFGADRDVYYLNRKRIVEGGRVPPWDLRIVSPTGQTTWVQLEASLAPVGVGPSQMLLVLSDISERKQAEEGQREQHDLLQAVIGNAAVGIAQLSPAGRFLLINPEFCRIIGYTQQEVLSQGFTFQQITFAEDLENDLAQVNRLLHGDGDRYSLEKRYIRKDGGVVWVSLSVFLQRDAEGRGLYFISAVQDITERRRNEARMRQLALAVEQSPETIVITDVEARIEYVNQAFERSTGYARDEVLGKNPRIFASGKTPADVYAKMWQALRDGKGWQGEMHNRRKDGRELLELLTIAPLLDPDGTTTHYVGIKQDITETRRIELELHSYRQGLEAVVAQRTEELVAARQQAESANRAKSAFLSNMSHEIRTPMNAIIGLSELMRRAAPTPEQATRLDKIATASQHLMGILNDVLDLSKIEAGRVELEHADFELSAVLDPVAAIVGESARAKGLALAVDLGAVADAPRWLRGDATRLRQALLNYAGNAVKFTASGGIVMRVRVLEQTVENMLLRFEVQDSGPGIAPEQLARLFQDFEQGDASITRQHGGTGLGLAITRRMARLMGGEAGADSTPGVGSSFWFTARLQRGEAPAATARAGGDTGASGAEEPLRQTHTGARILLAEDNPVNLELALIWLQDLGLVVDTANDGLEALERARGHHYDLVLMDMQMPGMDGLEATRAIRQLPGWQTVPILALTANAFDDSHLACEAAGMNALIAKPVSLPVLQAALAKWLAAAGAQATAQGS